MPVLEFPCEIAAPIEKVWAWHENVAVALPALSPPGDDVRLERLTGLPGVGFEVEITAKGPLGRRMTWLARYVEYVPPHPVVYGVEARFVDEQVRGPFAFWRHSHEFEAISDTRTRLLDRIKYRIPAWPLTAIADWLYIRPKVVAMFRHRHAVMHQIFGE